jgi:hypothetical protein
MKFKKSQNKENLTFLIFGAACTNKSVCLEPQTVALRGGFYYANSDTSISLKDSFLTNANIYFGQENLYFNNIKKSRNQQKPGSKYSEC